eukprot:Colp12_sorted_trinity150504_noHs@3039
MQQPQPGMGMGMPGGMGLAGNPEQFYMNNSNMGSMNQFASQQQQQSAVIIINQLNTEKVTPDVLFMLVGVYADVHRVKILFNKRDTALVQVADMNQAQTAITHLNNVNLFGSPIKVNISKHTSVSLPRADAEAEHQLFTKDYSTSPLHRFKDPRSKNFQNICMPGSTLLLSQIPEGTSEDLLRGLFSQYGTVVNFRFFPNNPKMGLLQMATTDEAVHALIFLHNHRFGERSYLRVSFSKSAF